MGRWRPTLFGTVLLAGLGFALSVVLALLVAQASFASTGANLFDVLAHADVRAAIRLSLLTATSAAVFGLVVAIPAAYVLARWSFPGRVLVDALLDVPVILSPVVVGISLMLVFRSLPGRWFEEHVFAVVFEVPGIIAAQFVLALALEIRVLKAAFEETDRRLEQVARFLGCTPFEAFRRVTLPLAKPGLAAAFVLGWSRALGDFGASVTIAGAVPGKTETIPVAVYMNLASVHIEKALALAMVLTFIAVVVLAGARAVTARGRP